MTVPQIVTTWSLEWPSSKQLSKMAATTTTTTTTTLPPIAFLDRHLPDQSPEDISPPHYSPPPPPATLFTDTNTTIAVDWLDFTHKRSAHFIAEKTCEMICYLWFTTPPSNHHNNDDNDDSLFSRPNSASTLQLVASPTFVSFMQKLLETTQVSQSVIVLSLHYIYRLKERNRFTPAQPGSEFRIAVAGLMMANKFLDDNTYTNKTWSEVSGIDLVEINRMEREFLMGVDCNLYVDKPTYESWLNLLKGLVLAKERDSRQYHHKSRSAARSARHPGSLLTNTPHRYSSRGKPVYHRARSTSPEHSHRTLVYVHPPPPPPPSLPIHSDLRSGAKRTAQAAFSPTSASFSNIPTKRPVSISLQIPLESGSYNSNSGPNSSSPLEGLQSFAKMSIDSPNTHSRSNGHHSSTRLSHAATAVEVVTPATNATTISGNTAPSPPSWSSVKQPVMPVTLSTAYALDERRRSTVPQNLYFYALACSPTDDEENESHNNQTHQHHQHRSRKARLRYHQPPPPSSSYYSSSTSSADDGAAPYYGYEYQYASRPPPPTYAYRSYPVNVQSASTSPVNHVSLVPPPPTSLESIPRMAGRSMSSRSLATTTTLPHFYETDWTGGKRRVYGEVGAGADASSLAPPPLHPTAPAPPFSTHSPSRYAQPPPAPSSYSPAEPPRYQAYVPRARVYVYDGDGDVDVGAVDSENELDRDQDIQVDDDDDDDDDDDEAVSDVSSHDREFDDEERAVGHRRTLDTDNDSPPIPSATFANAGPPGFQVQFCPTPERGSPVHPSHLGYAQRAGANAAALRRYGYGFGYGYGDVASSPSRPAPPVSVSVPVANATTTTVSGVPAPATPATATAGGYATGYAGYANGYPGYPSGYVGYPDAGLGVGMGVGAPPYGLGASWERSASRRSVCQ